MSSGAYRPHFPVRRPGGRPQQTPRYRVLLHRQFKHLWDALPDRVGLHSVQQFYDHVAHAPGSPAAINRTGVLRGKAGRPIAEGFSRTIHYEISGAGRIDYQFNDAYTGGTSGDPHPVVFILSINLSSH
ncbi:MAG: hypothetical protein ACRDSR_22035 [Pseudonocardiaceae bacterium]